MKNNLDFSIVAELENTDENLNEHASKTIEEDDNTNILEKEDQKTVGYQETLKIDVKNIAKNIKTICRPIYEVINVAFSKKQTILHNMSSIKVTHVYQPQFIPYGVKKS